MEQYYDLLWETLKNTPEAFETDDNIKTAFDRLIHYYTGGQWLRDYQLDERGQLPTELKRGVLSQDGVYNLLQELMKQE